MSNMGKPGVQAPGDTSGGDGETRGNSRPRLEQLLQRIGSQDREALAAFYDETSSRLYALALRVVRDQALAEDVVQEAYLAIWQQAENYDAARGKPLSWALTICHRRSVDRVRGEQTLKTRQEKYETEATPGVVEDFSDHVADQLAAQEVHGALATLPEKQKHLLTTVYFDGLTVKEAAEAHSIPLATAKTRLRDGLKKLRKEMGTDHV